MRHLSRLLLLALALVLAGLPVAAATEEPDACRAILDADDEPTDQELCTSQHWFTESTGKAGNVEGLSQAEGESTLGFPSWDETEPASVTTGAGGGYFGSPVMDIAYEQHPASGVTFEGELTGNIDALAFDLYLFLPSANATLEDTHSIRAKIEVDNRPVVSSGEAELVAIEPAGDAVFRIRFAVTGLTGPGGVALDNDQVHAVRINVTPFHFFHEALYVYDAAEAPANMIVNPTAEQLEDFQVIPRF